MKMLNKLEVGDYVTYVSNNTYEIGRIKRFTEFKGFIFVVYYCNNDWDNYQDYTGILTNKDSLKIGWRIYSLD